MTAAVIPENWPEYVSPPGGHLLAIGYGDRYAFGGAAYTYTVDCLSCTTARASTTILSMRVSPTHKDWEGQGRWGDNTTPNDTLLCVTGAGRVLRYLIDHSRREVVTQGLFRNPVPNPSIVTLFNDEAWAAAATMLAMGLTPWEALDVYAQACKVARP